MVGTLKYPINPAFDRYQAEAVLIGRILSSFGEIELTFCAGADAATEADKKLLKALYLLRTTSSRIDVADELMRPIYEQHRLLEPYTVTQTMVRYSLTIRNQYAHCNWADHPTAGLFFADLQTSAKNRSFDHFYKHVDIPLLTLQLEYLGATLQWIRHMDGELMVRQRRVKGHAWPEPEALLQPPLHNPTSQHVPLWLNNEGREVHLRRARELEERGQKQPRPPSILKLTEEEWIAKYRKEKRPLPNGS